jgi:hypothetical protein
LKPDGDRNINEDSCGLASIFGTVGGEAGAAECSAGSHLLLEHPARRLEYLGGHGGKLESEDFEWRRWTLGRWLGKVILGFVLGVVAVGLGVRVSALGQRR